MSLLSLTAKFECDGCEACFESSVDPAASIKANQHVMEVVEEYIAHYDGEVVPTVVHGMHLCADCARIAAKVGADPDKYASRDEIVQALGSDRLQYLNG